MGDPWKDTLNLDELLHSPIRFSILVFLLSNNHSKYREIQKALSLTAGNLTTHLKKLSEAEFIEIEKVFIDAKPTTIVHLTEKGRQAVKEYSENLQDILGKILKQ
jgi:DNA-binding MarR family transcriptional regulator